jgi:hypothetical protein
VAINLSDVLDQAQALLEWMDEDGVQHDGIANFKEYLNTKSSIKAELSDYKDRVWVRMLRLRAPAERSAMSPGRLHGRASKCSASTGDAAYVHRYVHARHTLRSAEDSIQDVQVLNTSDCEVWAVAGSCGFLTLHA